MPGRLTVYLPYLFVSFTVSALTVPVVRRLSLAAGGGGQGARNQRGLASDRHPEAGRIVPRLGGAGIFCSFLLPAIFWLAITGYQGELPYILIASAAVFAVGLYDDTKGSSIAARLLVESMAALLVYFAGLRVAIPWSCHGVFYFFRWLSLPVTIFWILVVTNSMNLIDGLDGLSAGTGILASAAFFAFGGLTAYGDFACMTLAGALAGFLIYNFPQASVFMGDSGSLFTGFVLACLSVSRFSRAATLASGMVSIAVLSVPVLDMLYAVLRRYYRGLPLGMADREHIHHKLLEKGLSGKKALFVLYSLNVAIISLCLLMSKTEGPVGILAVLLASAILGLRGFGYIKFRPFAKEMAKNMGHGRKRRYCDFAVRRFRRNASRASSLEPFWSEIGKLAVSVHLSELKIVLHALAGKIPFFLYSGGQTSGSSFTVSLPIACQENSPFCPGQISISVCARDDLIPHAAGLVHAISEETAQFLARTSFYPSGCAVAGGSGRFKRKKANKDARPGGWSYGGSFDFFHIGE